MERFHGRRTATSTDSATRAMIWRLGGQSWPPHLHRIGSMAFSAKIVGDELVLRIPMNAKPERSASGKTLVVASTHGNKETDCVVDGKKVTVGVNAYIPVR
jgi:hypothetical protein